jgi:cell division septation protein DedD
MQVPERIASDTPPSKPTFRAESATISYQADKQQDCPYIVQFCALSLEKDAMQIRDALKGASIQDARVESFKDISRGIQYFRVRAGCFTETMNAKTALDSFFKTAQRLKLGVVPIVVKQ